jgi:hypothetical protein
MASTIKVPSFDFGAFYYPEIIEALLQYKRENIGEITTENPFDPGIQMLRAFALVGHLNNVLLDLTAQESYIGTAELRESVARMLRLIGYTPKGNIPAKTNLRVELVQGFSSATLVVPDNAVFGTRKRSEANEILFEADEALTVQPTDQIASAWQYDAGTGLWTDRTTASNTDSSVAVWSNGIKSQLYLAHESILTDSISFSGITQGLDLGDHRTVNPIGFYLQFFDGNIEDTTPDLVIFPGSSPSVIRFDVNGLVGTKSKVGMRITILLNSTGVDEECEIQWDGTKNFVETLGYLGQSIVSTVSADYTVGSYWHDVPISTDTTRTTPPQIAGEAFDTGDTVATSFGPNVVNRWPLEAGTVVRWDYIVGAVAAFATYDTETGDLGGSAIAGTTVDVSTGAAKLVVSAAPDAVTITISYFRAAQTLQQDGEIGFAVPFTASQDWVKSTIPDSLRESTGPTTNAFWLRLIVTTLGAGATADLNFDRCRWDQGLMYLRIPVTQGETVSNEPLGSGDGTGSQAFALLESPVLEGSVLLTVDGELWTQVDDFFSSDDTDFHYTVGIDSDGVARILTGDGTNGVLVPDGTNNVFAEYRIGGDQNGNVGQNQILVNRTGVSRIRSISNPKPANGWLRQEGSGDADDAEFKTELERLKRNGISSLRTLERAVSAGDVEFLTTRFQTSDGTIPYSRSRAIENGFGLKTIKNVVVPKGGSVPSTIAKRAELDLYFNGDLSTGGVTPGIGPSNTEVLSVDYTPVIINVTATVTGGREALVRAALQAGIQPEAVLDEDEDGLTFRWKFGQNVPVSSIISLIFSADPKRVRDVAISSPASTVLIGDAELPKLGVLTLTVIQ